MRRQVGLRGRQRHELRLAAADVAIEALEIEAAYDLFANQRDGVLKVAIRIA